MTSRRCNTAFVSPTNDDDLTPEQFDAAFRDAEPVDVVGHPKIVVQDLTSVPGVGPASRPDLTFGTSVLVPVEMQTRYEPVLPGARRGAVATA